MFLRLHSLLRFSSSSSLHTTPATSPTLSTGFKLNPCATPLGDGLSGRQAGPIPNTGYEPKFCIDVDSGHTPINLPSRSMSFRKRTTRRSQLVRILICLDILWHQAAASIRQQAEFPPCQNQDQQELAPGNLVADCGALVSHTCIKETCADIDSETVVSSLFGFVSKERRD